MKRLIQAFSPSVLSPAVDADISEWRPPESLEWMPAGESTIRVSIGGKPDDLIVITGPEDAARLDAQLQEMLRRAAAGEQSRPYIDKDHQGGEAMALPVRFFWSDGIRLAVEWTAAGFAALKGRVYSYFSPEWFHGADGHPMAVPDVGAIGSLVNTPAFQTIERLAASRISEGGASATTKPTKQTMENTLKVLVEAKLIPSAKLDDAEAATIARESIKALMERHEEALKAKDGELTSLRTERDTALKSEAESLVAEAVKAGKLKDDATLRGTWVNSILKDKASATAMLAGIEPSKKSTGREPLEDDGGGGGGKDAEINRLLKASASTEDPLERGRIAKQLRTLRNGESKTTN